MIGRRAFLVGPALAPLLGGCAALEALNRDPPRIYRITSKSTFDPPPPRTGKVVLVEVPTAAAGLNTTRIALRPKLTALDYFGNSLWVEVVPLMVQRALIDSLDQSRAVDATSTAEAPEDADFALYTNILAFQADYDEGLGRPPVANVRIVVDLIRLPARKRSARVDFQERLRAESTSIGSIVEAIDAAMGKVLSRIVRWTAEQISG
mgnify:CR=1 FL=1